MFIDKVDEGQLGPESYKINGTELTQSTNPSYIAVELNLTKGQVVDFEGFSYLDYMLQPEYFTNENGQYKFNAPDGKYRISYNKDRELIYVEKTTDTEFPETVWITGAAFGHPRISGLLPDDIGNWGWDNQTDKQRSKSSDAAGRQIGSTISRQPCMAENTKLVPPASSVITIRSSCSYIVLKILDDLFHY